MKKNRIIALSAAAVLSATAVIGGTMAYFTDTDSATNTFTVGNVKIALHESNTDGDEDEAYRTWLSGQKLIPTTEAKVENTISKIVTVENTGDNDAYLWAEIWVPASLDDGDENSDTAPGIGNSLHFNYPENVTETPAAYLGSEEKDGVLYNKYVHYIDQVIPGKTLDGSTYRTYRTDPLLSQVYMDAEVTQCTDEAHSEDCLVLMDGTTHYSGSWELIINAVGIQADQFENINEAMNAYYEKK